MLQEKAPPCDGEQSRDTDLWVTVRARGGVAEKDEGPIWNTFRRQNLRILTGPCLVEMWVQARRETWADNAGLEGTIAKPGEEMRSP